MSLLRLYSEIFVDRSYDVTGLGDTPHIIDCGGNIGLSVVRFKQQYPHAAITVFEADPSIATVLDDNMQRLRLESVEVVHAAVGGSSGAVKFLPEEKGTLGGRIVSGAGIVVECICLADRICEPVDLLKMDIEGSEFDVIRDLCASGKIEFVKRMICEIHSDHLTRDQVGELWTALSAAGFHITIDRTVSEYPEPREHTPFANAPHAEFAVLVYAWRRS
jgi:FkbM family methyltransferase